MQFSAQALCTAPLVWLWLSLMLIQQARGFAVLFQLTDLRTLTLTSFLYPRLTQLSIFREEAEAQGGVSRAAWQAMLAVHHTYPETVRMVYPHPQPANGHLQTLTHSCLLWLSPFIPGSIQRKPLVCSHTQLCRGEPFTWCNRWAQHYLSLFPHTSWIPGMWKHPKPLSSPSKILSKCPFPWLDTNLRNPHGFNSQPLTFISLTLFPWSNLWYHWLMWDCLHIQCWQPGYFLTPRRDLIAFLYTDSSVECALDSNMRFRIK